MPASSNPPRPPNAASALPHRIVAAFAVLVLSGCADRITQPDPSILGDPVLLQVSPDSTPTQLAVAQSVPGFGGYFLDAAGRPTVYLLDAAHRPAAELALGAFLAERGFTAADLQVRQGTHLYTQLDSWYRAVRPNVFGVAGIVLGDVDEGNNRLYFASAAPRRL